MMSESGSSVTVSAQSVWSALISIIDQPQATLANLLAFPRRQWLLPLLLSLIVLAISVTLTAPYSSELVRAAAERQWQSLGLTPAQVEDARAQAEAFTSPMAVAIQGVLAGGVGVLILWVLAATLLHFAALIAGAESTFAGVFTVFAWSSLPITLRSIIQTIYILVSQTFPVYPGLAALQVSGDTVQDSTNPLIALLRYADPFWLWHVVLLVIGLAVAAKFTKMKAAMLVLFYAVISIGISVGFTLLGRVMQSGG